MGDSIHEIRKIGNLYFLINAFIGAYNRRTDVLAQGGNSQFPDLQMMAARLETIHSLIFELNRKVETMSSNIDRIEKEAADAAENVGLVRAALETLNTTVTELKSTVADLKQQVAQGQLDQARLDAAAAALEKADEDMDALVLPPAPPTEPTEPTV
ncbi:MAG TPA: hypothetical protein VF290_18125 [Pyrinomonadaceae bacterium]